MTRPTSILIYGGPGAGKTAFGVSSFWDYKEGKQIRNGRILFFGREANDALDIPEELVRRFAMSETNSEEMMEQFYKWMKKLAVETQAGHGLDVLVIDGFSEWNHLFIHLQEDAKSSYEPYRALKANLISMLQLLQPKELGCHVIATARVTERRKGTKNVRTGEITGDDPDWMDYAYYPEMEGWGRRNLPHYFELMLYMEQDMAVANVDGKRVKKAVHKLYTLPSGDFWIKNNWQHRLNGPHYLIDPSFNDLLNLIEEARLPTKNQEEEK